MKKLFAIIGLVTLFAVSAVAQDQVQVMSGIANKAFLFRTETNPADDDADTTGYLSYYVSGADLLLAKEVGVIVVSSDSNYSYVYFQGRNSVVTSLTDQYTDSIEVDAATTSVFMLKDDVVNRLEGCDQFRIGVVHQAAGAAAASTVKWYLWVRW